MMNSLIYSEDQFRNIIPNLIPAAKGELPYIERIAGYVEAAQQWLSNMFTGAKLTAELIGRDADDPLRVAAARLVMIHAVRKAVPALDVVLSPNGFGIISNSTVAPASQKRIDNIIDQLTAQHDDAIDGILALLPRETEWIDSEQAAWFRESLFQDLGVVRILYPDCRDRWGQYAQTRQGIMNVEMKFAAGWFSHELMDSLRRKIQVNDLNPRERVLVKGVRNAVIDAVRSGYHDERLLADLVQFIREFPEDFDLWHKSKTAQLFSPAVFRNQKYAGGYFF